MQEPILLYGKRWQIETLFGCLKSKGFGFEETHITKPERIEKLGGTILLNSQFTHGEVKNNGFHLIISNNGQQEDVLCANLINAGGLRAQEISHNILGTPKNSIPPTHFAKGNYFKYAGKNPFNRLVYPLPEKAGLGIHATIDVLGNLRFGPDVEWVATLDYSVSFEKKNAFAQEIKKYFPKINEADLIPEFSGIRPKIIPKEQQPQDFCIQSHADHGVKGLINLYGIESPGLTASLSIGEYVNRLILQPEPENMNRLRAKL